MAETRTSPSKPRERPKPRPEPERPRERDVDRTDRGAGTEKFERPSPLTERDGDGLYRSK